MNNTCDLRVEFVKRMLEVKSKRIWDDEQLADVKDREDSPSMDEDDDEGEGFIEDDIAAGGIIRLPIDTHTKSIRAMYVRQKNEEKSAYVRSMQKKLCRVLSLCDQVSTVNIDITKTKALYGYSYIELKINEDARALLNATSIDFELQIEIDNGQLVLKRFNLNCPARGRQKRKVVYTKWGGWWYRSILYESYFPEYKEHRIRIGGKICSVGCVAVAWAMVFGYYNRRSHFQPHRFGRGSQSLYTGISDKKCVAPRYANGSLIHLYIKMLSRLLWTYCWRNMGLTSAHNVGRVEKFFTENQKSGQPKLSCDKRFTTTPFSAYAKLARSWIRKGWPVVVGTKQNGQEHAEVATRYRGSRRTWRRCNRVSGRWQCTARRKQVVFQMYVHRGLGKRPLWISMRIHSVAVAWY